MSDRNTRKSAIEEDSKSKRYFHFKPLEYLSNLQPPTNKDIIQRFFWIQDHENKLRPKKEIAMQIYNALSEKYGKIPCSMKGK